MVKIKGRIYRSGGSYAILIPATLIKTGVLKEREVAEFELVNSEFIRDIQKALKTPANSDQETWVKLEPVIVPPRHYDFTWQHVSGNLLA